jgi:peptidoglycan/LPS O-acetylase OafA/YrhL
MPRNNNFDLIRLFAALQVAITHSLPYFVSDIGNSKLMYILELFPGVPVFFFISGFLISKSFEKNSNVREFFVNRILRIYPALAVCFALSLVVVSASGYFATVRPSAVAFITWVLAQLSFVQFYNPEFMRHYGTGVLNGSIWTITIELQFYALVPVVYLFVRKLSGGGRRNSNWALLAACGAFAIVNCLYVRDATHNAHQLWFKLLSVSFLPWFYMFLTGVLFQRYFHYVSRWFSGRFPPILVAYCVVAVLGYKFLRLNLGNTLSVPLFLALAVLAFAAAFSANTLSERLLRRNDISYGVYIFHMPVVNLLLTLGISGWAGFSVAFALTVICATLSWVFIEKPALSWKRQTTYAHSDSGYADTQVRRRES